MAPILVRDLMSVGVPTCKLHTPIPEIARFLIEQQVEGMCVLDDEGNGAGVVGVAELAAVAARQEAFTALDAEAVMREGMPVIQPELPIGLAVQFMQDQNTRIAYITHNSAGIIYPAAYFSFRHVLRYLAAENAQELKDLGISAARQSPLEVFIQRRDAARKQARKG